MHNPGTCLALASSGAVAMASMIDSEAFFASRCERAGLSGQVVKKLKSLGWSTYATFAFSVLDQNDEKAWIDKVLQPVLGDDRSDAARLRRMFLEAYTHTAADLKRQTELTEQDAPRRLPPQELDARLALLQEKILPLKIQGRLEPSHHLINTVCQMVDDQRIRYVPWSACTTRAQEINSVREVASMKVWQPDKSGVIKQVTQGPDIQASTCNELDVMQALRRRGVAYAVGQLMSFASHELVISMLFDELQREPQPGFHAVSLGQIAQADREIHVRLGELTRGGLSLGPGGELPLDLPLREVLKSPAVMWLLMPKLKQGSTPSATSVDVPVPPGDPAKKKKKKKKTDKKTDGDDPEGESPSKKRRVPMPKQLLGGSPDDPQGNPLCFGYSLKTCKVNGAKCGKGLHRCCLCFGAHPMLDCPKRKAS